MTDGYIINRDSDKWCASGPGFVNLQESPAGFGDTPKEALEALKASMDEAEMERRRFVRYWRCLSCGCVFGYRTPRDKAHCPKCGKMCDQCTSEVFDVERRIQERRVIVQGDGIKRFSLEERNQASSKELVKRYSGGDDK